MTAVAVCLLVAAIMVVPVVARTTGHHDGGRDCVRVVQRFVTPADRQWDRYMRYCLDQR